MNIFSMTISVKQSLKKADRVRCAAKGEAVGYTGLPCGLKVGDRLIVDGRELFKVLGAGWRPSSDGSPASRVFDLEALDDVAPSADCEAAVERHGFALAWITMSDKGAAGLREDASGPLLATLVGEKLDLCHAQGFVIPDEVSTLRALLTELALEHGFDLILTTGGTGVAPRDITPEATLAVIDKRLPGYERAMTAASLAKTPHGAISRAVAGTLGGALIVNMPGSPKAVKECLAPLLPTFRHTLEKLQGDPADCASLSL